MRPDDADAAPLFDMLRYARGVRDSLAAATFESFVLDEIIGEAAREVSDRLRSSAPQIPWVKIIRQRHVLAHDYGSIRHDLLWRVAKQHIPELISHLEHLLDSISGP